MSAQEHRQPQLVADAAISMEAAEDRGAEIDLVELFFRVLENIKYILLGILVGALLMGLYSFVLVTPKYSSTAKLYVLGANDSVVNLSDLQIGSYLASDYQEVFKTWEVNERVLSNLGLAYTYEELQGMLSTSNPSNTRILYITVTSGSPLEAAQMANEYADVVREYIAETMSTEMPNILSTALQPLLPVSPNKTLNILLGALVGALVAVVIIVTAFLLDDKIKSTDDILKYAGLPTLAVVPIQDSQRAEKSRRPAKRKTGGKPR